MRRRKSGGQDSRARSRPRSRDAGTLRSAMHRLWADHVVWTRLYVMAAVAGSADVQAAAGRLLKNQEDIGNAIVPFYGQAAGAALTDLLKQHILIAVDLVDAALAGDKKRFKSEDEKWTKNAEDIAEFLSGANSNWDKQDLTDALLLHLKLTKDEAVARMEEDWTKDVRTFDEIFTEILTIADVLTDGLTKQFPELFAA